MSTYNQAREVLLHTDDQASLRPQLAGDWTGEYPLPAVAEMITTLPILGDIVTAAGALLTDANGLIQGRYLEETATRLTPVVGSPECAADVLAALGWQGSG